METRPLLALTFALAACAHNADIDNTGDNDNDVADEQIEGDPSTIDDNLERIAALEVFSIGALIADLPEEALHCYGPCPGWEEEYPEEAAAAAARLQAFADAAEAAVQDVEPPSAYTTFDDATAEAAAQDIATLASLEIVEVWSFLEVQPANNPSCYNLPCEEDIAVADDENCLRAARLEAIVQATKDL